MDVARAPIATDFSRVPPLQLDSKKVPLEEEQRGLVAVGNGGSFESSPGAGKRHFSRLLSDLAVEHDRQVSRLLGLIRDLRLELDRATKGENLKTSEFHVHGIELTRQPLFAEREGTAQSSVYSICTPRRGGAPGSSVAPVQAQHEASPLNGVQQVSTPRQSQPSNSKDLVSSEIPTAEIPSEERPEVNQLHEDPKSEQQTEGPRRFPSFREVSTGLMSVPTFQTITSQKSGEIANPGKLERLVQSPQFEIFSGLLIVANAVMMMIELQHLGLEAGFVTSYPGIHSRSWPGATKVFMVLEQIWVTVFAMELLVRFAGIRWRLFCQLLNWIDIISVIIGIVTLAVERSPVNPVIVRLFRLLKLVRGLRFLKISKVLHSLNLLIKCIQASVSTLFWSLCLLMMIQCIIGMIACQMSQEYVRDTSKPQANRHELYAYYGTFSRSFITMFELHMANWAKPCRVFMDSLGEIYGDIFVFYRCILGFSLMNVIGAVFVQQTMSVAQQDNDIMIVQKQRTAQSYRVKLAALFKTLDTSGDGLLSRDEFEAMAKDPALEAWMSALDINVHDLEGLFDLLDSGDGYISVDEFLTGAQRLQGVAKNIDMAHLMVTASRLDRNVQQLQGNLLAEELMPKLEPRLDQLEKNIKAACSSEDRSWWTIRRNQNQQIVQAQADSPAASSGFIMKASHVKSTV